MSTSFHVTLLGKPADAIGRDTITSAARAVMSLGALLFVSMIPVTLLVPE